MSAGSGNRSAALVVVIATCQLASHNAMRWFTPKWLKAHNYHLQWNILHIKQTLLTSCSYTWSLQTESLLTNAFVYFFIPKNGSLNWIIIIISCDIISVLPCSISLLLSLPAEGWAGWGRWSVCSQECGGGVQVRSRSCQPEDDVCEGTVEEGRACNPQPCIGKPTCHLVI